MDLAAEREINKDRENRKQSGKSSLQGLLLKAKKDQQKISQLQVTDSRAADRFKKEKIWQTVLEKSEGNKVRDDPQLLKKSLKKQQKMKYCSHSMWMEQNRPIEINKH